MLRVNQRNLQRRKTMRPSLDCFLSTGVAATPDFTLIVDDENLEEDDDSLCEDDDDEDDDSEWC